MPISGILQPISSLVCGMFILLKGDLCENRLKLALAENIIFLALFSVSFFPLKYRNNISVEENTSPGIVIFQVRATDADYGNNSIITYSLLASDYAAKFSIDPSSGNITVIGILDRENKSEVTLRINATDGTFSVTSVLFVIITDVNDNGPVFISGYVAYSYS